MDFVRGDSARRDGSGAWREHYRAASRRRRSSGGSAQVRAALKRRRFREKLALMVSALAIVALTGVFYLVLLHH
jgi:hypothetical protein